MAEQIIKIELGDGKKIVAEPNWNEDFKEICVWLEDSDGNMIQDLAIIGEEVEEHKEPLDDGSGYIYFTTPIHDNYYIRVYGDENNEDFTDEFMVGAYKEED